MTHYEYQQDVPSSSGHGMYTVSLTMLGEWQCSCVGWTRHMPRRDCKHIKKVRGPYESKYRLTKKAPPPSVVEPWQPMVTGPKGPEVVPVSDGDILSGRVDVGTAIANREASEANRIKREAADVKKKVKLGKLRYGFQLAHTYEPADLNDGQWIAEIKYDGELGMVIDGHIINRSGNDITHRFPEIEKRDDAVLVGELVVVDSAGKSQFNKIQERATDDPIKILTGARMNRARFMVFDMLEENDEDLTGMPLSGRRVILEAYFKDHGWIEGMELVQQLPVKSDAEVQALVNKCRELETEGVMVKDITKPYEAVRGRHWVKAKAWQEKEFSIVRYEETGVGDGFVIVIKTKDREQKVVCNSYAMQKEIRAGTKTVVEVKFLSEGADGALRFTSLRRLVR